MISNGSIKIEDSWLPLLQNEFSKSYMTELCDFLQVQSTAGKVIFPAEKDYFKALNLTPFDAVKVVILGQDPYHGEGQANGLCFSVPSGVKIPPSLANIYKELKGDLGLPIPQSGNLTTWAEQGVLLLNSVCSVEQSKANSHQNRGWELFTDKIIQVLNKQKKGVVFILWGAYAQKKGALIDTKKHCVLKSPHPSPLSSYRGFFGSKPFSQANQYLVTQGKSAIVWEHI